MSVLNKGKDIHFFRNFIVAAILAVLLHLLFLGIFSSKEVTTSKPASEMKRVFFLPLDAMQDSPMKRNFMRWIDYGDPTLISKPNQNHGFSTIYAASGLRTPEPDISYSVSEETVNPRMMTFEEIKTGKEPLSSELARYWDYRPASIPVLAVSTAPKKGPISYPLWMDGDGNYLPQFLSKSDDLQKKIDGLANDKKTVLKVTFYGNDFFPRAKIATSCGNQDLDNAAREAFIAKSSLLPEGYRKTEEPCYIEVEWRKGQAK